MTAWLRGRTGPDGGKGEGAGRAEMDRRREDGRAAVTVMEGWAGREWQMQRWKMAQLERTLRHAHTHTHVCFVICSCILAYVIICYTVYKIPEWEIKKRFSPEVLRIFFWSVSWLLDTQINILIINHFTLWGTLNPKLNVQSGKVEPIIGRGYKVPKKLLGSKALGVGEIPPELLKALDIVGLGLGWHTSSVLQDRKWQSGRDQRVCFSYQGITLLCLHGNISVTVPGETVSLDSC